MESSKEVGCHDSPVAGSEPIELYPKYGNTKYGNTGCT